MGTQNDYSVVRELANKIYYIEPNFVGGRRDNVPVSLEDLSVYVELKVEYNQTVTEVRKGGSYDIVLQVKLNREGSAAFVNLYSGVKYNNGNDVFLSTEGYENYTLDRISHSNTEEMFGVESINIAYNSFGVPEVELKFVDIKGAALHGAEELAHDINGNQVANISLTSKFLSCFYTVPFPRFQLVVKGYYGKPVFYDLTCSDLRSSFNAKSGNYDITVKMVGYSFALISDITFDSLLAAPYSKTGDEYWQDQISSGRFTINGKPMHKLTEIVNLWNDRLSDLQIEEDKGALQEQISASLDNANATYRSLFGLCATIRKNYSDYLVFDDESRLLFYKKTNFNELTAATSVFEEFQKDAIANMGGEKIIEIKRITTNRLEWFDYSNDNINEFLSKFNVSEVKDEWKVKVNGTENYTLKVCDLIRKFFIFLDQYINRQKLALQESTSVKEKLINDKLYEHYGYYPTLRNITRICFAHLETLLYMFNKVRLDDRIGEAHKFEKIYVKKMSNVGSQTSNNIDYYEEEWPSSVGMKDRPDVDMVNELIDGIRNVNTNTNYITSNNALNDYTKYAPIDLFLVNHPYKEKINGEIIKKRLNQLTIFSHKNGYIDYKSLGEYDAQCYIQYHLNADNELVEMLAFKTLDTLNVNGEKLGADAVKDLCKNLPSFDFYDGNEPFVKQRIYEKDYGNDKIKEFTAYQGWQSPWFNYEKYINKLSALIVPKAKKPIYSKEFKYKTFETFIATITEKGVTRDNEKAGSIGPVSRSKYGGTISLNWDNMREFSVGNMPSGIEDVTSYERYGIANDFIWNLPYEPSDRNIPDTQTDGPAHDGMAMKREHSDKYKYQYLIASQNFEHDHIYRVMRCHKDMNESEYTIITIPGLWASKADESSNIDEVDQDILLFAQDWYQNKTIEQKALLFLLTFRFGEGNDSTYELNVENSINYCLKFGEDKAHVMGVVEQVPYYMLLLIGGILQTKGFHCYNTSGRELDAKTVVYMPTEAGGGTGGSGTYVGKTYSHGIEYLYKLHSIQTLEYAYPEFVTKLKTTFVNWVTNTYTKWDKLFMKEEEKIKTFGDEYNSELYYAALNYKGGSEIIRFFRDTHEYVIEMTKEFFKLVWLVRFEKNLVYIGDGVVQSLDSIFDNNDDRKKYLDALNSTLEKHYENNINQKIAEMVPQLYNIKDYLHLNLYRYLKQIWDRWIIGGNQDYEKWKIEDVFEGPEKRIHFIDASYNEIGDIIVVHFAKFIELIVNCKTEEDLPFLTFLSFLYKDNNCMLTNVQNFINAQDKESIENVFKPLPYNSVNWQGLKRFSDLVVLFSFQAAESPQDSFDINDEYNLPPHYKNKIGNYHIPSFGVAYGMQNQNYFMDVSVSMNTPNVTDQSLQAMFEIANENKGTTDSSSEIRSIGQDMYRVYSNHAYQCVVKMMGCAWIQPLMYFQLMNIPLFRGAYIIHKVTHSITPNNMITTVTGTKVSQASIKKLESSFYFMERLITQSQNELFETNLADITNNCDYKYYLPYDETTQNSDKEKNLAILLRHFNMSIYDNITYGLFYAIILHETRNLRNIPNFIAYADIYLHNVWSYYQDKMTLTEDTLYFDLFRKIFINNTIWSNPDSYNGEILASKIGDKAYLEKVNTILTNMIKCFVDPLKFAEDIDGDEEDAIKKMTNYEINSIDGIGFYNKEYFDNNTNDYKTNLVIRLNQDSSVCFFKKGIDGNAYTYFSMSQNASYETLTPDKIINSINKSIAEFNSNVKVENTTSDIMRPLLAVKNKSDNSLNNDVDLKAKIFDMILQTYSHHFSDLIWVCESDNKSNEIYKTIGFVISTLANNSNSFSVRVGVKSAENYTFTAVGSHENLNIKFYTSLIKKYNFIKNDNEFKDMDNLFLTQCKNFSSLGTKEKVLEFFNSKESIKKIIIEDCNTLIENKINIEMDKNENFVPETSPEESFVGIPQYVTKYGSLRNQLHSNGESAIDVNSYTPSSAIIEAIKRFERFVPAWYKDADNYSIGYGFYKTSLDKMDASLRIPFNDVNDINSRNVVPLKDENGNKVSKGQLVDKEAPTYCKECVTMARANEMIVTILNTGFVPSLKRFAKSCINRKFTQNQMDALLCLVYNTGMGGIVNDANFTKALQNDDVTAITRCFKSKPHKDRREWELKVYLSLPSENWPPHPNAPLSRMAKSAINTVQQEDNDEMYNILARYGYTEMYSTNSSSRSEELAIYASTHTISQNEKGGRCALYVRKALMGALKLKTKGHPHSACAYWDLLEFWGFKRIYHGLTTQYKGGFQNGDIIVTSGLVNGPRGEKDKHGHIQIYYNGKWYADKCFNNANVYSKKGDRTCFLYRIM